MAGITKVLKQNMVIKLIYYKQQKSQLVSKAGFNQLAATATHTILY
ncbi:hypothetical protein [Shewanella sp. MEBiC00475]|nr:hypothetical protein [Shewanella sp. MEBiC00475]